MQDSILSELSIYGQDRLKELIIVQMDALIQKTEPQNHSQPSNHIPPAASQQARSWMMITGKWGAPQELSIV